MRFFAIIAAFTFAASVSAFLETCGINGALCDGTQKRSVGLTHKARAWVRANEEQIAGLIAREVEAATEEAAIVAREVEAATRAANIARAVQARNIAAREAEAGAYKA